MGDTVRFQRAIRSIDEDSTNHGAIRICEEGIYTIASKSFSRLEPFPVFDKSGNRNMVILREANSDVGMDPNEFSINIKERSAGVPTN